MPDPIQVPTTGETTQTSVLSPQNITGAPLISLAAALAGLSQYLAMHGANWPATGSEWASFIFGAIIALVGGFLRNPFAAAPPSPTIK